MMGKVGIERRGVLGLPLQAFDPLQEHKVVHRRLPHWSQPGTICFITLCTWDSMPAHVIATWLAERKTWLRRHEDQSCVGSQGAFLATRRVRSSGAVRRVLRPLPPLHRCKPDQGAAEARRVPPRAQHAGSSRGFRGGNWNNNSNNLAASNRNNNNPTNENNNIGFRVASS